MRSLAHTAAAGWPLSAILAIALVRQQIRVGRRRVTLNRALHELRRPLQTLALALSVSRAPAIAGSALELALVALARLDAEVNGGPGPEQPPPARARDLLEAAVSRWRSRAAMAGGSIELRWRAPQHALVAAPAAVAQAVDNLLVNAIEHGGPAVLVECTLRRGKVRIRVADSGRGSRGEARRETPAEAIARLTGRRRRGHGLTAVREVASSQGGRFAFQRSEAGSVAVLELPLAGAAGAMAA
jgi:signal transduction histidine kinase